MFRANMCPSSGETTVYMRHLVFAILCELLSGMQGVNKVFIAKVRSFFKHALYEQT